MARIAFLGTPAVAVPVLRALASQHRVEAVFANPDRPQGRGRKLEAPPVKQAALELGLPVYQPESWKLPETRALWESLDIDVAIVVAYGHILPTWMLDSCSPWNLHFSLLPRWRGAAPVNHAILGGDAETGVSLMRIAPGLDAGPVLAVARRPIGFHAERPRPASAGAGPSALARGRIGSGGHPPQGLRGRGPQALRRGPGHPSLGQGRSLA
ncbi:MAG: methionyl-tRNA formyltransferase [Holophagaceae bacterium]|nr:methionyl-tRNA formyltransferase [Holophagaceae bacterium]